MPISFNFKFKRISKVVRLKNSLSDNNADWMVWSYCGIYKNNSAKSQPNALVAFRELSSGSLSDSVILRRVPLTSLGQLRIGTVWNESVCRSEAIWDSSEFPFSIDFTKGSWKLTSFFETTKGELPPPYPNSIYPLPYPGDKNWFIEFKLPTGGKLVIPCLELFSRCYGRSEELKRILSTYPWNGQRDSVMSRLYAPIDEPEEPGKWKVKLKKRLVNGDVVLLAHAKYDRYTENAAKSIYAQIETQHDPKNKIPAFIKVAPWFQGAAQLMAKGIWFDNNRSFLALQIIGCSDPDGGLIMRDRENSNKAINSADEDTANEAWSGTPQRELVKSPDIIDLTGDVEPDHGAAAVEIQDPDFVVIGQPRLVRDVRKDRAKTVAGLKSKGTDATAFSSGEHQGNGKGVGYASIHARQILESHGALRDMWNAMLFLEKKQPGLITSVEWFTFEDGFSKDVVPKVIALQPFDKEDNVGPDVRNWLYLDTASKKPRGILVARVTAGGKPVHIIEIQRRPRTKKDEEGNVTASEESFKGLVFLLDDSSQLEEYLRETLSQVRHVKGIVNKLVASCPGMAADFKHVPAKRDEVPCEAAMMNALDKMGIRVIE